MLIKHVVGPDGIAQDMPLTEAEILQRGRDEEKHIALVEKYAAEAETKAQAMAKLQEKLAALGLDASDIKTLLGA